MTALTKRGKESKFETIKKASGKEASLESIAELKEHVIAAEAHVKVFARVPP